MLQKVTNERRERERDKWSEKREMHWREQKMEGVSLPSSGLPISLGSLVPSLGCPTYVELESSTLPKARWCCGKMETLGKRPSIAIKFDGRSEAWPLLKQELYQVLYGEGLGWVVEGSDLFCGMLQAAGAKAAKRKSEKAQGTVSTIFAN